LAAARLDVGLKHWTASAVSVWVLNDMGGLHVDAQVKVSLNVVGILIIGLAVHLVVELMFRLFL